MEIIKYETNLRRKLFMHKSSNLSFKPNINNEENKLINIYPTISFQNFIGFGGALTRISLL